VSTLSVATFSARLLRSRANAIHVLSEVAGTAVCYTENPPLGHLRFSSQILPFLLLARASALAVEALLWRDTGDNRWEAARTEGMIDRTLIVPSSMFIPQANAIALVLARRELESAQVCFQR
jgi:hypothetical protein